MPWLLQFSPLWLSSVSLKQTTKSSKQQCSPLFCVPKTDHISPHLVSLHWVLTGTQIQYKLTFMTELLTVYKTCQPCSSSHTSFSVFSLCAHTRLVRDLFLMLHHLSPWPNWIIKHTSFKSSLNSVYMCVHASGNLFWLCSNFHVLQFGELAHKK